MAESNKIPGHLFGFSINGVKIRCQADATLNITVNTSEDDLCKPENDEIADGNFVPWTTSTADSRTWNLDISAAMLRDTFAPANDNVAIDKMIIDGSIYVDDIEFGTAPGQKFATFGVLYSGSGLLTGFTLNAPVTGAATQDITILGSGPLVRTTIPMST